ncbi:DinB family protein [Georgenia sp. MJ206]|uniref:DinB family protein n=1 Tax=Georgenia wangjunii TaxID=3117730 RepID=UPI002F269E6B
MTNDAGTDDVTPDTKDWSWVLRHPCPDCGFDPAGASAHVVGGRIADALTPWPEILAAPGAAARPAPGAWSPLEYGCHLRDVCTVFAARLSSMLEDDDPTFPDWDQDAAAVAGRYGSADPGEVARSLDGAGKRLAARFAELAPHELERPGRRSDGAVFTAGSLGQYLLHELVHHAWDARQYRTLSHRGT